MMQQVAKVKTRLDSVSFSRRNRSVKMTERSLIRSISTKEKISMDKYDSNFQLATTGRAAKGARIGFNHDIKEDLISAREIKCNFATVTERPKARNTLLRHQSEAFIRLDDLVGMTAKISKIDSTYQSKRQNSKPLIQLPNGGTFQSAIKRTSTERQLERYKGVEKINRTINSSSPKPMLLQQKQLHQLQNTESKRSLGKKKKKKVKRPTVKAAMHVPVLFTAKAKGKTTMCSKHS